MVTKRVSRRKIEKEAVNAEQINLRDYEVVFIIRPDIAEDNLTPIIEKVSQYITNKGGTVSSMERWGKRKLAYPINHYMEGYYVFGRFKLQPSANHELESNLQIAEEIIRFLVIKND